MLEKRSIFFFVCVRTKRKTPADGPPGERVRTLLFVLNVELPQPEDVLLRNIADLMAVDHPCVVERQRIGQEGWGILIGERWFCIISDNLRLRHVRFFVRNAALFHPVLLPCGIVPQF